MQLYFPWNKYLVFSMLMLILSVEINITFSSSCFMLHSWLIDDANNLSPSTVATISFCQENKHICICKQIHFVCIVWVVN
jgi:hypothetical protein